MIVGVIAEELLLGLAVPIDGYVDPDVFPQATIRVPGFLLFEGSFVEGDTIYQPYVGDVDNSIYPALVVDPDVFYGFSKGAAYAIVPPLVVANDIIAPPIVLSNVLGPQLFVDVDVFGGVKKVTLGKATINQTFPIQNVIDADIIYGPSVIRHNDAVVLLLDVFVDTDAIFTTTLGSGLRPGLVTEYSPNNDAIYPAGQVAFIKPGAFSSADTLFAPFIFNQLNPSRILDVDVFIGPELRTPGRMGLFVDDDIFFVPVVHYASLLPASVGSDDTFLSPFIGSNPALWPFDALVDFTDTVYAPNVILFQRLAPHIWIDVDTIPLIANVVLGLDKSLLPGGFVDVDTIYAPTIPASAVLATFDGTTANVTLTNGNLKATHNSTASNSGATSTMLLSTGKYYFEVTIGASHGNNDSVALVISGTNFASIISGQGGVVAFNGGGGLIFNVGTNTGKTVGTWTAGDVICYAADLTNGKVWVRRNSGNWNGDPTANPATGVGYIGSGSTGGSAIAPNLTFGGTGTALNDNMTANFGGSAFAFTPPSGFGNWSM